MPDLHNTHDLIAIFNQTFKQSENTILVKGGGEPIYLPAGKECTSNRVIFAHGYFTSALHEISHWCIAGKHRRTLIDFGYWYEPDGRSADQQKAFEQVEVKPQALEWIFSAAAGVRFNISADNLSGEISPSAMAFKRNVQRQATQFITTGLTGRARKFVESLCRFYGTKHPLDEKLFLLENI